jgi:diguanylate cyclase (GGDEF)-like protein/PAS domain S-box-containing protein
LVKGELSARSLERSATYAIERQHQRVALRLAHDAVLEANARFQAGFDSAPIGMALVALDGRFIEVNEALREMVGYVEPQLLSISVRDMVHANDLDGFDAAFNPLRSGELASFRTECRLVGLNDRDIWTLVAAAMVQDAKGQPAYVIVQVEDISARKDAEARLVHQTLHDSLTGLPNRVLLEDRLGHALARLDRRRESVGVFYVDLDRFKLINDTLGHEYGDQLIVEIGRRLSAAVRPSDTVARLGGDEFVVLAEDLGGRDEASDMAERLRTAVSAPIRLAGTDVVALASIGVALAADRYGTPEQLLREADTAMYSAKQHGKDRHEIFDGGLLVTAMQRVSTEAVIRRAIASDYVAVVYQPLVDLTTSQVVGLEALMRIDDPEQGLLLPHDFISTAEDTGLIVPTGMWVLTKAIEEAARWLEHRRGAPFKVHVNLSARQLGLPALAEDIAMILAANSVPAQHLCLELTETVLIDATASTIRGLTELKELGVGLGIDDFGTGYASLTYLRRFPVDFVKIDTTFVAGLPDSQDDVAIVKAVIGLGQSLGLTTIAEGVETEAQLETLRAFGCDLAQGYLLGTPQRSADLKALRSDRAGPRSSTAE